MANESEKSKNSVSPESKPTLPEEFRPEVVAVERQIETTPEPPAPPSPRAAGTGSASAIEAPETTPSLPEIEDSPEETTPVMDRGLHLPAEKSRLRRILHSKKFWASLILLLVAAAIAAWFIQPSRWMIVNALGLKNTLSITTRTTAEGEQKSALLKNVAIAVNGEITLTTNAQGTIQTTMPYGALKIVATKAGYDTLVYEDIFDFDPFFQLFGTADKTSRSVELRLKSVGVPVQFKAKDWLTGEPLGAGDFSVGDVVARPDQDGLVSLKIPATDNPTVKVKATFSGRYNDKEFDVKVATKPEEFVFVPSGRHYFISKRTGQFMVYASDLDGSNVAEIVPGTGSETVNINLAVSPSGKYAALASSREGARNSRGELVQKLYIVNLSTKEITATDEALAFKFADWAGDTLIYTATTTTNVVQDGAFRLKSLDMTSATRTDLAIISGDSIVRVALGSAIYTKTSTDDGQKNDLFVISAKGGTEKKIGTKITKLSQVEHDRMAYVTDDGVWHEYSLNTASARNISAPTSADRAFLASTSGDGQYRLFVDRIDGKDVLIAKSVATGEEKQIFNGSTLGAPVNWHGTVIAFNIYNNQETADHVISVQGGEPKKITDSYRSGLKSTATGAAFMFY